MTPKAFFHPGIRGIVGAVILLGVVISATFTIWQLSDSARREINELATAKGDSSLWSLARFEVELVEFENQLLSAIAFPKPSLHEVRNHFDIFYARLQIIKSAQSLARIRELPGIPEYIERLDTFSRNTVGLIDGDDEELRAALPSIAAAMEELHEPVRQLSLSGVGVFSARSTQQRDVFAGLLYNLGRTVALLVAVLLGAIGILILTASQSRRKTEEITQAENRLKAIVATSIDAILVTDRDGTVLDFNGAAERIFERTRDNVIGKKVFEELIAEDERQSFLMQIERILDTSTPLVSMGTLRSHGIDDHGRTFPIEYSMSRAQIAGRTALVTFIRDISIRVAAQRELMDALDRAVAGERTKADMLAVMSHEMRTPLNGVLGALELLSESALDEDQARLVSVMDGSGKLLLEHVNNVLELLRVDAGKAVTSKGDFNLMDVVDVAVEGLKNTAGQRGNRIEVMADASVPKIVRGDGFRLQRILVNLIGNAVKFTENGRITVEIEGKPDTDRVMFRVTDTGIGIRKQDLDRIFEDFVTLDASFQREVEGTGLGLGIVRRVVHLLEGELGVESIQGEGSVFWVSLPLPEADAHATETPEASRGLLVSGPAGARVLVVEDNQVNLLVVREMLVRMGCEVAQAEDGLIGVGMAREQGFDLILMDISMPKLDGLAAARLIRGGDGPNRDTPILALTAHVLDEDRDAIRLAGMTAVLSKPVSYEQLRKALSEAIAAPEREAEPVNGDETGELAVLLGDVEARRVMARAITDIRAGMGDLEGMMARHGTMSEVERMAHQLCGAAGLVGLTDLSEIFVEMQELARSGKAESLGAALERAKSELEGMG